MRTVVGQVFFQGGRRIKIKNVDGEVLAVLPAGANGRHWRGEVATVAINDDGQVETLHLGSTQQPESSPKLRQRSTLLYPPRPRH